MSIQDALANLVSAERALAPLEARERELADQLIRVRGSIETARTERNAAEAALLREARGASAPATKDMAAPEKKEVPPRAAKVAPTPAAADLDDLPF